jgi:hypothetical protein
VTGQNIHSIKLKGPWSMLRRPGDETVTDGSAMDTVHLPAEWQTIFGPVAGTAVFERRFNRPTGLSARHRVRIVLRDVTGLQQVALNEVPLSVENDAAGLQFVEITRQMEPHNRLTIELQFDPARDPAKQGGLWQPVILEIKAPMETDS